MTTSLYNLTDFPPGLVAIPATDWMWTKSVLALLALTQALPPYSSLDINPQLSSPAANRNFMTERFLTVPRFEWILYLDSDMTPPPATIARLLSHNVDIVGATCYTRSGEYLPCWNELPGEEIDASGLQRVATVGTGCLLVRRAVLEMIETPYFEHTIPSMGEDLSFCLKARAKGFSIFRDAALTVGHLHVLPIDEQNVMQLREQPRVQQLGASRADQSNSAQMRLHDRVIDQRFFDDNGVKVEQPAAAR